MTRRNQFKVSAESVQGNAESWLRCKAITIGKFRAWRDDPKTGDTDIVNEYVLDWGGILDDDGHEIPSPKVEPGALDLIYLHEMHRMALLVLQGPVDLKN